MIRKGIRLLDPGVQFASKARSRRMTLPWDLIQFEVRSGPRRRPEHEAQSFYGRADHRDIEGARGRGFGRICAASKHGVSDDGIYRWKAKFDGMDVSETKRLRTLEDANARLRRLRVLLKRQGYTRPETSQQPKDR
jgi:hypothetical protein